jgi:hypothetical protein
MRRDRLHDKAVRALLRTAPDSGASAEQARRWYAEHADEFAALSSSDSGRRAGSSGGGRR